MENASAAEGTLTQGFSELPVLKIQGRLSTRAKLEEFKKPVSLRFHEKTVHGWYDVAGTYMVQDIVMGPRKEVMESKFPEQESPTTPRTDRQPACAWTLLRTEIHQLGKPLGPRLEGLTFRRFSLTLSWNRLIFSRFNFSSAPHISSYMKLSLKHSVLWWYPLSTPLSFKNEFLNFLMPLHRTCLLARGAWNQTLRVLTELRALTLFSKGLVFKA